MTRYLTIHVRAHEGRYHGDGDDPPSPFRLFQALVAGAGISGPLDGQAKCALAWLQGLPDAPIIASPRAVRGQSVSMFMPNNDLDAKGGDVRRISEIRLATKVWRPRLFDAKVPWVYAWPFADPDETHAGALCALSEKLYQLGRGVDMAWAWGELLDEPALEAQLATYDGVVRRPSAETASFSRVLMRAHSRASSVATRHDAFGMRAVGACSFSRQSQAIDSSHMRARQRDAYSSFGPRPTRSVVWRGRSRARRRWSLRRAKQLERG
jgi:CRISPR-associated protein Csb2